MSWAVLNPYWCAAVGDFNRCVDEAFKAGKITKATAEHIKGADDAEQAINGLVDNLTLQKRDAAIQAVRMADAFKNIKSHDKGEYAGLMALMVKDPTGKAPYANIDYMAQVIRGDFHSDIAEMLSRFRTRRIGFEQDEEGLKNFAKAVYGETVDDPEIMKFAQDWKLLTEKIRGRFNKAGGAIGKNEKWLFPQNHNARAIENRGLDEWKKSITPKLDRTQMVNDAGKPVSDAELEESLNFVFETIISGGLNKAKDFSVANMGKKLSRRGSEKRFLFFKSADDWLEYQKEFGRGDVFTTMTDWVDSKAQDIALMETLGTNPEQTFKALSGQIEKEAGLTNKQKSMSQAVFNVISGKTNQGNLTGVADFMQSTRNVLTAALLGKAFLSAFSDVGFQAITSRYNGIPALKVLSRQMSLMNPANEADRIVGIKIGLIADAWLGRAHAANRYADVYGTGVTAKMAEGVMRASLLAPWTDAGRKAFGMEFSSMLADNFNKPMASLDDSVKKAFDTYGINSADWDKFRKSKVLNHKGAKFADFTQEGGEKFNRMVLTETDYAVPTPDSRVRAITTGGTGRATVAGQAWRSVMHLKSFPITIATTHFYRAAYQATTADKLAYAGLLFATTSVFGGIALQAKDLAAGREPRPMDNAKFFGAAVAQGGGLGIFGDFLFSDVNRFGGGLAKTALGPTGDLLDNTVKFTLGNIRQAIQGEETNVLGEGAQLLRRYTPDIWQTQLFKNAVFDQIELLSNPQASRKFNKITRKRATEYDQGYWWRRGELSPEALK